MANSRQLLYRLYQNNRKNSEFSGKWYARAVYTNEIDLDGVAELIQRNTTAKKADCLAVLTEMVEVIRDQIQSSHVVNINGLGRFKIGLHTAPANTAADFSVQENVLGKHVNFLPEMRGGAQKGSKKQIYLLDGMSVREAPKNAVDTSTPADDQEP